MGRRAAADKRAIDLSVEVGGDPQKPEPQQKPRDDVGSDADRELRTYFSGGYAGQAGLRSSAGGQLDRIAFRLGRVTGLRDAVDQQVLDSVFEMRRVERTLEALRGPAPEPKDPKMPTDGEQMRRRDWALYYPVLRGYYTPRPLGAPHAAVLYFAEYAGVVLALPEARALAAQWCARRLEQDLEDNRRLAEESRVASEQNAGILEGQLRMTLATGGPAKHLRARHLRRQIAQARAPGPRPVTDEVIYRRWRVPAEQHAAEALRELLDRAAAPKESPERELARKQRDDLLEAAKRLLEAAKTVYRWERRRAGRDIREERRQLVKAQNDRLGSGWAASDRDAGDDD